MHTLTSAKKYLAAIAPELSLTGRDGEFRVRFKADKTDAADYFTNDLQDAIGAAIKMVEHRKGIAAQRYDQSGYYIVGIARKDRELIVVAGPYSTRSNAIDDIQSHDGHPDYFDYCTLSGASCEGLRSWEDM